MSMDEDGLYYLLDTDEYFLCCASAIADLRSADVVYT
jgi:hypothetical protein